MTAPDLVKGSDLPGDPVDARICFLLRMSILRELSDEEKLELQQLEAAEKAQPGPKEAMQ